MAETLPDAPWATGGGNTLPDAPWAPPAPEKPGALSHLGMAVTDIPREAYQTTADALAGARDNLLPGMLGGKRDPLKEGALQSFVNTGRGLASAASVPFAPIVGAARSLVGHPITAADIAARKLIVGLRGEDKVRAAEKAYGSTEGGLTYDEAKEGADLALGALAPSRGGLSTLRGPVPQPPAPPTGPLGVTLSKGQETGDLTLIRREQAAQRGQLGPEAERVAKEFNEQQAPEVAAAKEQVERGLDPFGAKVAETPQEAGALVSDAIQKEAAARKAGVDQAYKYANALPGEIHASAFKTIAPDIKLDLSLRPEPIIIDDKLTPFASRALQDIETRIGKLNIQNRADPFGQPAAQNISGVTLKGVEQQRKRLSSFRSDAYSSGNAADGRAAKAVLDAFDDHIESAVRGGFFNGDPRAVQAWLDARAAHADYKRTFSAGKNDPIGRVVERIIGKGNNPAAIPNDVADFMYGSSGVNPNSLNVGVAKRIRSLLGDQSPEWSGVKQGLFSRLTEPAPGVTDWGPQKIAQRLTRFMNGDGKEMAQLVFSPAERKLIEQYVELQRHLEVPASGVNRSETSSFVVPMLKKIGTGISALIGAAIGHAVAPGLYGAGELIGGLAIGKGSGTISNALNARTISKQMPQVSTRLKQYQRAVAAANRANSPVSNTAVGVASANLLRSLEVLGIRPESLGKLQGPVPARSEDEQQ